MRLTGSIQTSRWVGRRGGATLLATLVVVAMSLTIAPLAQAAPAGTSTSGVEANDVEVQTDLPVQFAELRLMIEEFEASGDVSFRGAARMLFVLTMAEYSYRRGSPGLVVNGLETIKELAAEPIFVPSEHARDEIIAAADDFIELLRGLPS